MARNRNTRRPTKADLPEDLAGINQVRLTSFQAENILRIKAVRLELDKLGDVITIEGDNEQGKSSVLKSIEMLIAGASTVPPEPIHGDRGQGKVVGRFDTNIGRLVVTKEFKRNKPIKLVVRLEDQKRALSSPQTILDVLLDHIALDPLQFQKMPDEQKGQVIAELAELDLTSINKKRAELYEERTAVNRQVKILGDGYEALVKHEDAPDTEVTVTELVAELELRQKHNAEGERLEETLVMARNTLKAKTEALEAARATVATLENDVAEAESIKSDTLKALAHFEPQDEDKIRQDIAEADEINRKVRENQKRRDVGIDYTKVKEQADNLTTQIEQLDAKKRAMLVEAESRLPVEGLGFNDDGVVTYKGKPFMQAGSSATALISCGVSMALNKDRPLKLMLIDDAEKMDGKTKRKVAEMGLRNGFQICMAQVMSSAGPSAGSVVIEDGEVKG
jgi:hypothetical protein